MDLKKRTAFTLAEMMVVLLVLSLITAAFLPVITRRTRQTNTASGSEIWQWASNASDIYFIKGDTSGASIGVNKFEAGDNPARLLLNIADDTQDDILFKQNAVTTGKMRLDTNQNIGIGGCDINGVQKIVALGAGTTSTGSFSTTIGARASSTTQGGTSLGYGASATNIYSTAIGSMGPASKNVTDAAAPTIQTIANGAGSVSLGVASNSDGDGSMALGAFSEASQDYSIAIGPGAKASGNSTAVGTLADATGRYSSAFGNNAKATEDGSMAIGTDSGGHGARSTTADQIVIGTDSQTVNIPGVLYLGTAYSGAITGPLPLIRTSNNGGIYWSSDRRLKNVKGKSKVGLNEIRQIEVDDYTFKADRRKTPQIGVIAQALQKVFPNSVSKGPNGYLAISQNEMFYAMLNSIKQLDAMFQGWVKDFKAVVTRVQVVEDKVVALIKVDKINSEKIKSLEAKNKQLEARLAKLEKRVK